MTLMKSKELFIRIKRKCLCGELLGMQYSLAD